MAKDKPMVKELKTTRTFSYQKDDVNLSFTLNIDNSSKLRHFKSLLEAAIVDVTEQIEGMKN